MKRKVSKLAERTDASRRPSADALASIRQAAAARTYVSLGSRRTTSVHEFYRYPARFSPDFARSVIAAFSRPADVVVDPFVGGGTTLVEARLSGRLAIGSDINALATFVATAKTLVHTQASLDAIWGWAEDLDDVLNVTRRADWEDHWEEAGYLRHLDTADTWRIRNLIAQSLTALERLKLSKERTLARCAILRTAQWALDMREEVPPAGLFRDKLIETLGQMVLVAQQFSRDALAMDRTIPAAGLRRTLVLRQGLPGLGNRRVVKSYPSPALVLTSPPYPGVYVNYHRWKVRGRKETAAPFWVAGCLDGHGLSHYTMAAKVSRQNLNAYFDRLEAAWNDVASLVDDDTWIVQVVGFHHPERDLPQYLEVMQRVGLQEERFDELATAADGRLWREVPSRRWWVVSSTREGTAAHTAHEVVLVHRVAAG
jgi:hypothetical protein